MDYIQEILLDAANASSAATSGREYVRAMLDGARRGRANHRLLIWSLLCFEWWNRLFIDGEPTGRHQDWHSASVSGRPRR